MKLLPFLVLFAALATAAHSMPSRSEPEDSTGLPGDNFSLHGALAMFQKAASPEEFEKLINTKENSVNNLDLNGDGDIDYIRVVSKKDGDVHVFALQVPVSQTENQDIAVIELEKTGDGSAILQIVGDEDIYGEQTIVEPGEGDQENEEDDDGDAEEENGEGHGPFVLLSPGISSPVVVNVWLWPSVRFVYAPGYMVWVSPWGWHRHPVWWHPWRPLRWSVFHPMRVRYHAGFAVVHTHRVVRAHRVYSPGRVTSVTVRTRHQGTVNRYRVTRTTTVRTKAGVKTKTTRTTVRTKRRR